MSRSNAVSGVSSYSSRSLAITSKGEVVDTPSKELAIAAKLDK